MPLRLRMQPAKVGLRVGQERRGGLSITSRSPICHVPAVHRWTHGAIPLPSLTMSSTAQFLARTLLYPSETPSPRHLGISKPILSHCIASHR